LENDFVESKVVAGVFVGTIFANLENQSITTRMASIPFHFHEVHGDTFS
jgi:hypothetical protein